MEANPLITEGVKRGMVVRIPLNVEKYGNVEIKPITPSFNAPNALAKNETPTTKAIEKTPAETKPVSPQQNPSLVSSKKETVVNNTKPIPKQETKQEVTSVQSPAGMPGKVLKEVNKDGVRKIFYKVGNGETLQTIAQKFNTTDKSIANTNMISSGNVSGGQIIKIEIEEKVALVSETPKAAQPKTDAKKEEKSNVKESAKETWTEAKSAVKELVKKEEQSPEPIVTTPVKSDDDKLVVKTINNKKYIIHTTSSSNETVDMIADMYAVSVKKIKDANNLTNSKLRNKQSIKVPVSETQLSKLIVENKKNQSNNNIQETKSVAASSNGSSSPEISSVNDTTRYTWGDKIHLTEEDMSKLRKKAEDEAKTLAIAEVHANGGGTTNEEFSHPVMKGETIESIAKKYNVTTSDLANWNGLWDYRVREGLELIVNAKRARKPYFALNSTNAEQVKTIKANDKSSLVEDIYEQGLCLYTEDIKFKGILHKTAPVGTLIMIENNDNFKRRFFTTTGVLRDSSNSDVIIQIDDETAKQLDINNPLTNVKLRFGLVQ
jgi:LysM repeat protein